MRKYLFIHTCLMLLLLLISSIKSFSQWNNVYAFPIGTSFNYVGGFKDAAFLSPQNAVLGYQYSSPASPSSGRSLYLKATQNSGVNWNQTFADYGDVGTYFIDVARSQNTFYHIYDKMHNFYVDKSTDNGNTWQRNNAGYWQSLAAFSIVDTSCLFFAIYSSINSQYIIGKYKNGIYNDCDTLNKRPGSLFFTDSLTGYLSASDTQGLNKRYILKSITGGNNWITVFDDSLISINKLLFLNADIGFAVANEGKIIKTSDGGLNWQYLATNVTVNLKAVYFMNDQRGFVAGDSGTIIRTVDGGNTWTKDITGTNESFRKIFVLQDTMGYAIATSVSLYWELANLYKTSVSLSTGLWEHADENQMDLYPNPSSGNFTLKFDHEIKSGNIKITDMQGRIVFKDVIASEKEKSIFLKNMSAGIYFVEMFDESKWISKKIILE